MTTDEELFEEMKRQQESPDDPKMRRVAKPVYAKSEFKAADLKEKIGERVWVRCISDAQPWADEKPMMLWKEYSVKVEEAVLLDERKFAVILHSREALSKMSAGDEFTGQTNVKPIRTAT